MLIMAMEDPATPVRREQFRALCESRGWRHDSGRWAVGDIAMATGKHKQKLSDLLNGHGNFGAKIARELEDALGLKQFSLDGAEDDGFVDVMRVNVKLGAGPGRIEELTEAIGPLKFTRSFLQSCGVNPGHALVLDVKGHSMEPTVQNGAVVLISTANRQPMNNAVFALHHHGEGCILKRLVKVGDVWVARSDNREFADIPIHDGQPLKIIGRAHWMGVRL